MKRIILFILAVICVYPFYIQANYSGLLTYTWALDSKNNGNNFPLLSQFSNATLRGYPIPSKTLLIPDGRMSEVWHSVDNVGDSAAKDFVAIYRARPAGKTIPNYHDVNFNNWAFIRKFIFFGGESGSGAHVVAPDPKWVDAAHKSGVKIFGTVFLATPSHGGNESMASELFGTRKENKSKDDYSGYDIPNIEKLVLIAKHLNIDGWFINFESFNLGSSDSERNLRQAGYLTKYVFPKIKKEHGVEFTIYVPSKRIADKYDIETDVIDDNILNFAYFVQGHGNKLNYSLNVNLIQGKERKGAYSYNGQTYLMFLDEPYWRSWNIFWANSIAYQPLSLTDLDKTLIARVESVACQFFNGAKDSGAIWLGLKYYTKMRYPHGSNKAAQLCGGNTSFDLGRTLKINKKYLKNDVEIQVISPEPTTSPACTVENRDKCSFNIRGEGDVFIEMLSPGYLKYNEFHISDLGWIQPWSLVVFPKYSASASGVSCKHVASARLGAWRKITCVFKVSNNSNILPNYAASSRDLVIRPRFDDRRAPALIIH